MADFTFWTLPMPVVGRQGSMVSVDAIFKQSFGSVPADASHFFAAYFGYGDMSVRDFDFWNPNKPQTDNWVLDGVDHGPSFNNQIYFSLAEQKNATLTIGNTIGPTAFLTVPNAGPQGGWTSYVEYSVMTIDPDLMMKGAGTKAPDAGDIVKQAYRFAEAYGTPINSNDCHFIAAAVAASAGATFTAGGNTQNVEDPSQNIEHGFWRIAYRGSDAHPIKDWQTLVKPGDIVRMGWTNGGFHTATVLSVSAEKKTIKVYDNTNAGGTIGVHDVNFDRITKPGSITIYRLTADNLYLEVGSSRAESIAGTIFNDKIVGLGGDDHLFGAGGNDLLVGGAGNDVMSGGIGNDAYYVDSSGDKIVEEVNAGTDTVYLSSSFTLTAKQQVETLRSQNQAGTVALNITGNEFNQTIYGNAGANKLKGLDGVDKLFGYDGNDTLNGGAGKDYLYGGSGDDRFAFNTALNASTNVDVITDFHNVKGDNDGFELENSIFTTLGSAGALTAGFFRANATGTAADSNDHIIYETDTGKLFYDSNGSAAGGSVQFAVLTGHPALTAADFLVV